MLRLVPLVADSRALAGGSGVAGCDVRWIVDGTMH